MQTTHARNAQPRRRTKHRRLLHLHSSLIGLRRRRLRSPLVASAGSAGCRLVTQGVFSAGGRPPVGSRSRLRGERTRCSAAVLRARRGASSFPSRMLRSDSSADLRSAGLRRSPEGEWTSSEACTQRALSAHLPTAVVRNDEVGLRAGKMTPENVMSLVTRIGEPNHSRGVLFY